MAKKDYLNRDDAGKCSLMLHVKNNLPTYFSTLNITAITPQVLAQSNDVLAFDYACRAQQTLIPAGHEATNNKNRLRDGDPLLPTTPVVLTFPASPGAAPTAVLPGVVTRFRLFVSWLRSLPGMTEAIGEALRLIGDEETLADLSTVKPTFHLSINGGRVEYDWKWLGLSGQVDAQEIWKDPGDGHFKLLAVDTRPDYVDTEPFPSTPTKWRYKSIWVKDGQHVGLWSDIAEIMVG